MRLGCALLLLCGTAASLAAWEPPVEAPRVMQSFITALYAPSLGLFSEADYPLQDNFSVDGSWINLFPKGQNLNLYFGFGHSIKDLPLFPATSPQTEGFDLAQQARDTLYGKITYVFYDYFQLNGGIEYLQNRKTAARDGFEDYDFDRLGLSAALSWDLRYSSIEQYYKGKVFLYPEEGFRLSAGLRENRYSPAGDSLATGGGAGWSPQAFASIQYLLHPHPFWVLAFDGKGTGNLAADSPRVQAATSTVLGALDAAGDYAVDADIELRFLYPKGFFWESPEFWRISSFLFKFSPGLVLGYDAGVVGLYGSGSNSRLFQQSVYVSPLVSIRMNGDLETVLRADFALASSGLYRLVLSASFGTVGGGTPSTLFKEGLR